MISNKTLGISALVIGGFIVLGDKAKAFANQYISDLKRIEIEPKNISNFDWVSGFTDPRVRFNVDLELQNPSDTDFNFQGGNTFKIEQIEFLNNLGEVLATSYHLLDAVSLPARGIFRINNIQVDLPVKKLGETISMFTSIDPTDFKVRITANLAGKRFIISNLNQ